MQSGMSARRQPHTAQPYTQLCALLQAWGLSVAVGPGGEESRARARARSAGMRLRSSIQAGRSAFNIPASTNRKAWMLFGVIFRSASHYASRIIPTVDDTVGTTPLPVSRCHPPRRTNAMSTADESCDAARYAVSATLPPCSRIGADVEVKVQPVPGAAARILPSGGRGIARDRFRVWSTYGQCFRQAMSSVAANMPKRTRGLPGDIISSLADIAAVHLYLNEEWRRVDAAVIRGRKGPHLALARCVASGLRRLPPFRGPAIARIGMPGEVTDWYRENTFIVDQGFWTASTAAAALGQGGPGFLVWSLTGRRTGKIDPADPGRLIFSPGTRFKVLDVMGAPRPLVMMREMFPSEPAAHRLARSENDHIKWLDESTVENLLQAVETPTEGTVVAAGPSDRCPGLITTTAPAEATGEHPPKNEETGGSYRSEADETQEHARAAVRAAWSAAPRKP